MPLMTCAPSLAGSRFVLPVYIENMNSDVTMTSAEPMQTRICVLNPAGLLEDSLSKPIMPPRTAATASLSSISR